MIPLHVMGNIQCGFSARSCTSNKINLNAFCTGRKGAFTKDMDWEGVECLLEIVGRCIF